MRLLAPELTAALESVGRMTSDHTGRPDFCFDRPGSLIAALPAVLGFVPEKSLVLVSIEGGVMGAVMRADLSAELVGNIERLAEIAETSGAERVVAVIIDDDGALCPVCGEEHRRLAGALESALAQRAVELYAVHVVDRVQADGSWHCVDGCGQRGRVEDPSASPLAVAAVLDGRRLYSRRSELQSVIELSEAARSPQRTEAITTREQERDAEWGLDPDGCGRRDVETALAAAAMAWDGSEFDDRQLAVLACALTDVAVRDTLYALAVGDDCDRAEALWALLARERPDPWRVDALVLLACSAYARGDGPLAGVCLEAALRSDPSHRMAGMLDTALQSGMRPEQIRELAGTGYRIAKKIGVRLPRRRPFGRRAV